MSSDKTSPWSTQPANTNVDLTLGTTCNRRAQQVPNGAGGYEHNVCDPTGGYSFTQNTLDNFGKINIKRGHRVIELVRGGGRLTTRKAELRRNAEFGMRK